MKNDKIKFKIFIPIVIFVLAFFAMVSGVMAGECDTSSGKCYGLEDTKTTASNLPSVGVSDGKADIAGFIGKIIGAVLSFIGIIFFILMIYAGFLWMTAGGNEEKVKKAIDLAISAAIGLIIISAAYLITKLVGETLINNVV